MGDVRVPKDGEEEGLELLEVQRVTPGGVEVCQDSVVVEYPLTLLVNGAERVTLRCTPANLLELGVGFLRCEGIVQTREDIVHMSADRVRGTVEIEVRRVAALDESPQGDSDVPQLAGKAVAEADQVYPLVAEMERRARLFHMTGGAHVAALATPEKVLVTMEDIGRYNAVDKVVGHALLHELPTSDKLLLSSGRVSSELLLKARRAGVPILVSRSAPTTMAVKLARETGITLVGFARDHRISVYSHRERIQTAHPREGR